MARPRVRIEAERRAAELARAFGSEVRRLREDAGLSQTAVSRAAGVSQGLVSFVEAGQVKPTIETMAALGAALGADLGIRLFPGAGVPLRDRFQARMLEALLQIVHPAWHAHPEVGVTRPARGFIDTVLVRGPTVVVTEVQSELRRLEAQLRWHEEKTAGLPSSLLWRYLGDEPTVSRLLLLRSTRTTRELARRFEQTLAAAFPARATDALAALTSDGRQWPGAAILWVRVEGRTVEILLGPPRGVRLGR